MYRLWSVAAVFCLIFAAGSVRALADAAAEKSIEELKKENQQLRQRTEKLEQEMAELKKMVAEQAKALNEVAEKAAPAETAPPKLSEEELKKIAEFAKKGEKKKPVWSDLDIQLYGYIKADAAWDSSQVTTGNYEAYADRNGRGSSEFNMTANQTRFGLKINGPEYGDMKTSGLVEVDFYGTDAPENKAKLRMRHAYMTLDWPKDRFSIIAGQTWDVISPLVPDTLNFLVLWDAGNIGHRHPQIRLTKDIQLNQDVDMRLEGAISRTIGVSEELTSAGSDAGFPTMQGRVGFTFPWLGYKPTTIGFSGHWGREKYSSSSTVATTKKFNSWSFNLDMVQPITELWSVKGEAFCGENLDNYFGGIGQGVRTTTSGDVTSYHNTIGSKGGWVQLSLTPKGKWNFNFGIGVDDVKNGDINVGQRARNRSIFGNAIYSINKNAQIGFELSQWKTDYKGPGDSEDVRAQTSFIYKF
jgi:hypothetical protein